jgi:hypothetical protein
MGSEYKVFSLDPIIDRSKQVLILGSIPGKEFLAKNSIMQIQGISFGEMSFLS